MPVPTPTSSTRSRGWMFIRWMAWSRPGWRVGPEEQVVDLGELVVDRFDEVVLDGGSRQGPGRGVRAGDQFIFPFGFSLEYGHQVVVSGPQSPPRIVQAKCL